MASNYFIYILQLTNNKYYIGKSTNPNKRYQQHTEGTGSAWTKQFTPIKLLKIIPSDSPFDEDKYTKEYMNIYGIDNVRGGSYSSIILSKTQIDLLNKELWNANEQCNRCGRMGHFSKYCYASSTIHGKIIDIHKSDYKSNSKSNSNSDSDSDSDSDSNSDSDSDSNSDSDSDSDSNSDSDSDSDSHSKKITKYKKNNYTSYNKYNNIKCFRCGRNDHYKSDCYAIYHINGYKLK